MAKYELAWPKGPSRIICVLANPDHPGFFLILTLFFLAQKKKNIFKYFLLKSWERFP